MLKKSLYFSNPYHLTCKQEQLIIKDRNAGTEHSIPVEDIAFIVLDHYGISVSQYLLQKLTQSNVAVISCNEKHMPVALLFPLDSNQTQSERFQAQVQASEPLKKQLWQQTIRQKIANQAAVLEEVSTDTFESGMVYEPWIPLQKMSMDVKSGDSSGREAKAARFYWKKLFGDNFNRERFGEPPNPSLNYGYAIIRAAVARALCGSGLLPTLGIHHHNKYNAYCLADDIMEPYRPFVDRLVWQMKTTNPDYHTMQKEQKAQFLELLASDVHINGKTRPMMIAMSQTTSSLADCFLGKTKKIKYPTLK